MPHCEKCQANLLSDSQHCEHCGHLLGTEVASNSKDASKDTSQLTATPGSLRSEVPYLSGSVGQAKVRLGNWKQKGEVARQEAQRQSEFRKQEKEAERKETVGKGARFLQFLAGLCAMVVFVYLLIRLPRKGSQVVLLQYLQRVLEAMNLSDD